MTTRFKVPAEFVAKHPWLHPDVHPNEQEHWSGLVRDLFAAHEEEVLEAWEVSTYFRMLGEMFAAGMRSPSHVMVARFCFLHTEPGEA